MNQQFTTQAIFDKLSPALEQENMHVTVLEESNDTVRIRITRTGPGSPVAFMVKAIEGTFKKHHPHIHKVELVEYQSNQQSVVSSELTEQVLKPHGGVHIAAQGNPVLNLAGHDQKESVQALEAFVRMWSQTVSLAGVQGLDETGPQNALKKWGSHFSKSYAQIIPDPHDSNTAWITFDKDASLKDRSHDHEILPAKAYL